MTPVIVSRLGTVHRLVVSSDGARDNVACTAPGAKPREVSPLQIRVFHLTRCDRCWPHGWPHGGDWAFLRGGVA